jgi:hypothetical protein
MWEGFRCQCCLALLFVSTRNLNLMACLPLRPDWGVPGIFSIAERSKRLALEGTAI